MSYQQACKAAGCEAKRYHYAKPSLSSCDRKSSFVPASHDDPNEIWHKKAEQFVDQAHECLMSDTEALTWLHEKRGICPDGARRFKLGLNSNERYFRPRESWGLPAIKKQNGKSKILWLPRGLVIPYIVNGQVHRIRIRRPKSDLKGPADPPYYFVPGSSPAIMLIGKNMKAYMVVESELDGILIAQDAGDLVGVLAMGTAISKPDEPCAVHLSKAEDILVSLDSDTAGKKRICCKKYFPYRSIQMPFRQRGRRNRYPSQGIADCWFYKQFLTAAGWCVYIGPWRKISARKGWRGKVGS
jgi:hypothetical protein